MSTENSSSSEDVANPIESGLNGGNGNGNGHPKQPEEAERNAMPIDTEAPPRLPFPVIGIGASAGGLQAVTEFLSTMPPDSGTACVLVQHLPATGESMLVDILSKRTQMPVLHVEENMPVEPNHFYVIRPAHTLTIKDGKFELGPRLASPMHSRPVDDFFKSLAEEQRERAVAIVLSGMGSNGAAGAQAIKAVGGLCIAQDPETTQYPSMPRHLIDAGYADYILSPHDMPDVILAYAGHPYVQGAREEQMALAQREQQHLREILAVLRTRTRQNFTGYKKPTVLRRIQRRMGLTRFVKIGEYAKFLRQNSAEVSALADDLLIHVTGFFRDADAWEALRKQVVVPLINSRESDSTIRCWVAACSSGEEAYSLAILLVEEAERLNKPLDIKVFATDMAERTLQNARNGAYPGGIEAEIEPRRLERFFQREDSIYRVRQDLRERVVFAPQNVLQDPPFSRLDIITCRNLLIYLEPDVQVRILSLLHFGLREGGALFLGSSETAGGDEMFQVVDKKWRIYRRVGHTRHGMADFPMPHSIAGLGIDDGAGEPRPAIPRPSLAQMTHRALLDFHTPAAVTVDRDRRVVYFHGDTHPYLRTPSGEPTRDLMELARDTVRGALRSALIHAASSKETFTSNEGWLHQGDRRVRVSVTASPLDPKSAPDYLLVSFIQREELPHSTAAPAPLLADLSSNEELRRLRDELQTTIEELQTSNEELKASHEEVVSANEELQSTNEELETSREEMQSLNEELSTVNTQLHAKMEEHQTARNDLMSLLTSIDIGVLFLDPQFRIRRYTFAIRELMDIITSDIGRPLSNLHKKFDDPSLIPDAETVLAKLTPIEREITAENGRIYVRRVLPHRTADNRIDGVVMTFVDISDRKRVEIARQASEDRLRALVETTNNIVYRMSADWSKMLELHGSQFLTDTREPSASWIDRYIPPDEQAIVLGTIARAVEQKITFSLEHRVVRANGSIGWVLSRAIPLLDKDGNIVEWFGAASDISARKVAEAALREREEQLRLIVEGSHDFAMVSLDPQGKITGWNPAAQTMFGYSEGEAVGQMFPLIFTPEDRVKGAPEQELADARKSPAATDDRWHQRQNDERFWGRGVISALRDPDGTLRGFVKVMRDETLRKRAEESLRDSKESAELANRIKDEFLATVSHELRTPLSAILLWSKMLQNGPSPTDPQQFKEGMRAIQHSAEAQRELVDDLLDISRITTGGLRLVVREIDLARTIHDAIEAITPAVNAKGIQLQTQIDPDIGIVRADGERLRQVVWNLLSNAVKFTGEKGQVHVTVRRAGREVEIRVIDSGRGLEADFLPCVFERFRQADRGASRRHGGLGLGLAIAKQLVELHGGTIAAESPGAGKGSTFTVRLPLPRLIAGADDAAPASADDAEVKLTGARVLLVEDEDENRRAVATLLRAAEMNVVEVNSAAAALKAYEKSPPDLIVSDIGMPVMDGYALMRRIRQIESAGKRPAVAALALTAFARDTDAQLSADAGFQRHLGKPVDPEQFLLLLREMLPARA